MEELPRDHFYLRAGLGRKASGSYYTPHAFVRFLVRETLGPQVATLSPAAAPNPLAILSLRVLDPAMGTGHFLVQACRFLGQALFDALSTENSTARRQLDATPELAPLSKGPYDALALAECRTLVARHCLYGVDKNPLAVELARASIWLESRGTLPLTFTGNHLVAGDSVTGPTLEHLFRLPGSDATLERCGPDPRLGERLQQRLTELQNAQNDRVRNEFRLLAASWTGAVMLGGEAGNDAAYARLAAAVAAGISSKPS